MEPQKQKRLRGKSPETQYSEAVEELNRLVHTPDVDEVKIKAQRTLVIALAKRVAAKQKNKKIDKLGQLRMVVKTLEEKVAALTTEVEKLKQRLAGPVMPQADPAVDTTLAKMMADSTDASLNNSTSSPTLERMRRGEQVGGGPPKLPTISGIPEHVFQPVRLTPPRVEPVEPRAAETSAQPRPVPPAADTIEAKAARIQAESRRNAPTSKVAAIEAAEQRLADLQRTMSDGYQQTLAVEATFPAKSPEETAALVLMEKRYGDSPEAIAAREQKVQAAIAEVERRKQSIPDPTSPGIKAIEAEIAYANDLERRKKENAEVLAALAKKKQARANGDIT